MVVERDEPADLMDTWSGHPRVVVVDAVRSGAAPGTVHVLDAGRNSGPLSQEAWGATGRGGTHALGLAAVVELARALGTLPDHVVVVGVEGEQLDHGAPLSPAVAEAVSPAAARVLSLLRQPVWTPVGIGHAPSHQQGAGLRRGGTPRALNRPAGFVDVEHPEPPTECS